MSRHLSGGRHELGQNFLVDRGVIAAVLTCVAETDGAETGGPLIELGPGDGALTVPLSRTGRPLTAIELDARRAERLRERTGVTVVHGDYLRHRFPWHRHTVVGNIPFHITTATLRTLLAAPGWRDAVLIVQWEVARRRAGIGGATLLTAAWWPWFEFRVRARVPARAFRPVPGVDGAILTITRRAVPLVADRQGYQHFVKRVFTGRGRGIGAILGKAGHPAAAKRAGVPRDALPRDLTADQWARLWTVVVETLATTGAGRGDSAVVRSRR
ncbi:23S ribosomal RNA methyltransferase Erm [Actinokineospora sp. 24-640]